MKFPLTFLNAHYLNLISLWLVLFNYYLSKFPVNENKIEKLEWLKLGGKIRAKQFEEKMLNFDSGTILFRIWTMQ